MKYIELTQNKKAMVDDEDYEWLNGHKWHSTHNYAARRQTLQEGGRVVYMHREILGAPRELFVDHKDGNRLNNQRSNIRLSTKNGNEHNTGLRKNNTSGFKGVYKHTSANRYIAQIVFNGKRRYLGSFITPQEAARAYDRAASRNFGEFARLNNA